MVWAANADDLTGKPPGIPRYYARSMRCDAHLSILPFHASHLVTGDNFHTDFILKTHPR